MTSKSVQRPSDKYSDRKLQIICAEADGDIMISVYGNDSLTGRFVSISTVFCNSGHGGGQSPKTYQALLVLKKAMEEDNFNPFYRSRQ